MNILARLTIFLSLILLVNPISAQRPNIIYIMTDDMGYGDLSCYGNKKFLTPNLDKLASQGVKFVNAYAAAPVCTPTRTALMTGRYPARLPVGLMEPLRSPKKDSAVGLTRDIPSLGTLMKAGGYETVLIGKWHLGFMPQHSPTKNGFDYFFGIHSGGADYISHKGENGTKAHDLYENDSQVHTEGYLTDLLSQKSVSFISQKHTKPFLLIVTFNAPHWPWQGPGDLAYPDSTEFTAGGSPSVYADMIKSMDDGVGRIMKALDDSQLSSNTMVIFTNDNGGERYSDNGGLSKRKMTLWEGGIRVPALVKWPGKINAGKITQQVATTMDWTATILKAGGAKADKSFPLDGIDLVPVLTGKSKNIDRTLYWRTFQRTKHKAVRDGKWKYLEDEKGEYLFDLGVDQAEKNDLKTKEKKQFEKMKLKLAEWEKTVLQPIPL
ncbi:MAG: sulfatase-like hydrolase/transferase [Bacteroidota bacterium]